MARAKRITYLGGGFIPGIPARDMTKTEAKVYGLERMLKSGLYKDNAPPTYQDDVDVLSNEIEMMEQTFKED